MIVLFVTLDLLLQLHASILEPDFDLPLRQTECMGHFNASPPGQVVISMKLLFKFERLISSVGLSTPSSQSM